MQIFGPEAALSQRFFIRSHVQGELIELWLMYVRLAGFVVWHHCHVRKAHMWTHLDAPRRERMKWNDMNWDNAILLYQVGMGGLCPSHHTHTRTRAHTHTRTHTHTHTHNCASPHSQTHIHLKLIICASEDPSSPTCVRLVPLGHGGLEGTLTRWNLDCALHMLDSTSGRKNQKSSLPWFASHLLG